MLEENKKIEEQNEEITFEMPDNENIPCKTCIFSTQYYLDYFCAKYKMKPKEVYYKNQKCPNYKPR